MYIAPNQKILRSLNNDTSMNATIIHCDNSTNIWL